MRLENFNYSSTVLFERRKLDMKMDHIFEESNPLRKMENWQDKSQLRLAVWFCPHCVPTLTKTVCHNGMGGQDVQPV